MAFPTRLTKVGYSSAHCNERTGMCYHQTPPWERGVADVGDARQAQPHLEHNPLSLLGVRHAIPMRKLNDPANAASGIDTALGVFWARFTASFGPSGIHQSLPLQQTCSTWRLGIRPWTRR